ncbi:GNAT family N-acetyltransferase [Thermoleptolyngbya sp. C42_A2020_037]|uniref:GNAT family N-acetyltransferase n=1 Tax=Thermoleptolyngbya sp. C42_A2020_037 TaxID=2747799 RepID=UPI0019E4B0DA|nr:GNAT family N-acetyltransferase [Thermoleptolyngbya sp. C42_A2020_037]MBF2083015.1 GNAT family N-acetyltransferase [Thermoleptolyngbya sp. C42_A2020_037]
MFNIRLATPADAPAVFELILALAEYEKLTHEVVGNVDLLAEHLGGDRPLVEALLAEVNQQTVGFALFFSNYSTFLTQPGIYLEDLFVRPEHRGQGIGKALLSTLAKLALERGCGRLEWNVLDWNEPAIAFYERMGAKILPDWRTCRVTGGAIAQLANLGQSPSFPL